VLTEPIHITGQPIANLVASTSGTDSDWVVKLIDVFPDQVADHAEMGGYQLPVAMDIFRGRCRKSFSAPKAIEPGKPLPYRFALPPANHVFLPWPSHHGAGPIQLVSALRPQPSDLRAKYFLE